MILESRIYGHLSRLPGRFRRPAWCVAALLMLGAFLMELPSAAAKSTHNGRASVCAARLHEGRGTLAARGGVGRPSCADLYRLHVQEWTRRSPRLRGRCKLAESGGPTGRANGAIFARSPLRQGISACRRTGFRPRSGSISPRRAPGRERARSLAACSRCRRTETDSEPARGSATKGV